MHWVSSESVCRDVSDAAGETGLSWRMPTALHSDKDRGFRRIDNDGISHDSLAHRQPAELPALRQDAQRDGVNRLRNGNAVARSAFNPWLGVSLQFVDVSFTTPGLLYPRPRTAPRSYVQVPALHRMTSSVRTRIDSGIFSRIALAVLRFTSNSNLVGCSTGRSAGLAPLSILST